MKTITIELLWAFHNLFVERKHKMVLIGLILLAAAISIAELAVAKAFTTIVLSENKIDQKTLIILVIAFFFFFGLTRFGQFAQRLYRLKVFEKYLQVPSEKVTRSKENWSWSLAIELSNILGAITQIVVLSTLFLIFSPLFMLINILILIVVIQILGTLYKKQISEQRRFVKLAREKNHEKSSVLVKTRVRSGELGGLFSSIGMMILLGVLLYLSYQRSISPSDTVIIFFGLRMQNGNYTAISQGLMRFARARAQSE